ncbi:ABC transporter substrate-binding protein [Haloarculaceae archaeon H-GB2-1]|nr:ABC transporter substrate-binding protein [Haloarculaceae archaeon H-GB2-1]
MYHVKIQPTSDTVPTRGRRHRGFDRARRLSLTWTRWRIRDIGRDRSRRRADPLGSLVPLTGSAGAFGESMQRAIDLAVEHVNRSGGVDGRPLELYSADTETNPKRARSKLVAMIDDHDIVGFVGPYSSGVGTTLAPVAAAHQVMEVSHGNTSPVLSGMGYRAVDGQRLKYYGRTAPNDAQQGLVMARALTDHVEADSAAFLYVNNPYGEGLAEKARQAFDGEVTSMVAYSRETDDYRGTLDTVFANDPEAVGFVAYPENGRTIIEQWHEGDYGGTWVMADGINDTALLDDLSGVLDGHYLSSPIPQRTASHDTFVSAMGGADDVQLYSSHGYDALFLLALAMQRAGEASGAAIARHIRPVSHLGTTVGVDEFATAKALLSDGTNVDYEGASSDVDLTDRLEPVVRYSILQIRDAEPTTVEQVPVSWFDGKL